MTIFLTSSPTLGWAGDLNPSNGFLSTLRAALPRPIKCLMISSYPDDVEITDRMAWELRECFERANLAFDHFEVLDRRTFRSAHWMIKRANFIILCGGHVPTENKFFSELKLKEKIQDFEGVLLGISAGSMNCADIVYASPELPGESIDPDYKIFLRGLGLTDVNILPHFQNLKDAKLDGRRLIEDIVYEHSLGNPILCLPDGSYLYITPKHTEVRGLAYRIRNGKVRTVCYDNERKYVVKNCNVVQIR